MATSKKEIIRFSKRFLRWVIGQHSGNEYAAKKYCREKWERYGYEKIKKATKQKNCTTLIKLEIYLNQIQKNETKASVSRIQQAKRIS